MQLNDLDSIGVLILLVFKIFRGMVWFNMVKGLDWFGNFVGKKCFNVSIGSTDLGLQPFKDDTYLGWQVGRKKYFEVDIAYGHGILVQYETKKSLRTKYTFDL